MREIKFRAWDKKYEEMSQFEVMQQRAIFAIADGLTPEEFIVLPKHENIVLMQFTGLRDRNGVEIYEGDILKWWVSTTKTFADELLEVKWGNVGWVLKSPLFKRFGVSKEIAECSEVNTFGYVVDSEVIGNIYENPELLKG